MSGEPGEVSTHPCKCSARHVPALRMTELHHIFPKEWGGPADGEKVPLCPTGHYIVHYWFHERWRKAGAPQALGRGDNAYLRGVALDGWQRAVAAGWKPGE